jgi:hypothetical protein
MTRLLPPILTAGAVWALFLAEGHANSHALPEIEDPACAQAAETLARTGALGVLPGCPDPHTFTSDRS